MNKPWKQAEGKKSDKKGQSVSPLHYVQHFYQIKISSVYYFFII